MARRRTAYENNRRLLRNAHAKLRRLERKGIDTTGLLPQQNVNSLAGLVGWNRRLAEFNSRKTQFVAGKDGVPIPISDYKKLRDAENKYMKRAYLSFKRDFARQLYTASGRKLDMTVGEDKLFNTPYPSRGMSEFVQFKPENIKKYREVYPRLDITQISSVAELNKKINQLNSKEQKRAHDKCMAKFKQNVINEAKSHNDLRLAAEIERMTKAQLMFAFEQTDFIDIWKKAYYPIPGVEGDNRDGDLAYLHNILDLARKQVPALDQAKRDASIAKYENMDIEDLTAVVNKGNNKQATRDKNIDEDNSAASNAAFIGFIAGEAMGIYESETPKSYEEYVNNGKKIKEDEDKKQQGEVYRIERAITSNRLQTTGKVVMPKKHVIVNSKYDTSVKTGQSLLEENEGYEKADKSIIADLQNGSKGSVVRSYADALQMYMLDVELLTDSNSALYYSMLPKRAGKIVVPDFYLTHSDKDIIARRDKMLERKYGK